MVTIHDLPKVDRPREKLIKYGPEKLSVTELFAIILRTGTRSMNVLELSAYILKTVGCEHLPDVTLEQLIKLKGIGPSKSAEILAVLEFGKRMILVKEPVHIHSPRDVYESLKPISIHKKEHFIALYLDTRQQEITREIISIGILNASLVHPREVFEPAIRHLANSVIVIHNHPSNDPTPSQEDVVVTKQLQQAGKILDIPLTDHLIITKSGYISFKEQGIIE